MESTWIYRDRLRLIIYNHSRNRATMTSIQHFRTLSATNQNTAYLNTSLSRPGGISASNRADGCAKCIAATKSYPLEDKNLHPTPKRLHLHGCYTRRQSSERSFRNPDLIRRLRYYCPRRGCGAAAVGRDAWEMGYIAVVLTRCT